MFFFCRLVLMMHSPHISFFFKPHHIYNFLSDIFQCPRVISFLDRYSKKKKEKRVLGEFHVFLSHHSYFYQLNLMKSKVTLKIFKFSFNNWLKISKEKLQIAFLMGKYQSDRVSADPWILRNWSGFQNFQRRNLFKIYTIT